MSRFPRALHKRDKLLDTCRSVQRTPVLLSAVIFKLSCGTILFRKRPMAVDGHGWHFLTTEIHTNSLHVHVWMAKSS